jgi:hypothetical protein
MNENFSIVEVEQLGLPTSTAKEKKFHWLLKKADTTKLIRFNFRSMNTEIVSGNEINIRVFDEAELRFDKLFAKFSYLNDGHILMTKETSDIPTDLKTKIESFIDAL